MEKRAIRLERVGEGEFRGEMIGAGDEFLWGRSIREAWRIRRVEIEVAIQVLDDDGGFLPTDAHLLALDRSTPDRQDNCVHPELR